MNTGRFHLTLFFGDHPVMHGWWASRSTAAGKFVSWIGGEQGNVTGARVTLVDEVEGAVLTSWPATRPSAVSPGS